MNLAYVAGLVDGEGCIGFTKSRENLVPRICITNTNREIIESLKEKFGGSILQAKRVKENWKIGYHWVVTSKLAMDFLEKVYKYLILKSNQAICLYLYETIRPGKGKKWLPDSIEAALLLKKQVNWLNKKGINNLLEPIQQVLNHRGKRNENQFSRSETSLWRRS